MSENELHRQLDESLDAAVAYLGMHGRYHLAKAVADAAFDNNRLLAENAALAARVAELEALVVRQEQEEAT